MNDKTKPIKLDVDKILKSLPDSFTGVSNPKDTHTVYIEADATKLDAKAATKAVKKLGKELGLAIVSTLSTDQYHRFTLEDLQFNRDMRAAAKACLKAVKAFYDKYGIAYRYDDDACETVQNIIKKVNNED